MNAIVPAGGNTALTPTNMESAIQLAEMMARGKLVPQHLHNSPGDCLMVIEASMRWQMSPFAVAQCTSVIQGKLMFEGKLVAAALNASGILSSRLDYDFSGEGAQRAVTVRGKLRGETKDREVTVFLAEAKTSNGMWTKQPDQQLVYAATRVWARRHAPEVMLGVYAPEEFDRAEPFNGPTIEHAVSDAREQMNRDVPLKAAAAPMPRGARVAERAPAYEAPRPHPQMPSGPVDPNPVDPSTAPEKRTWAQWKDALEIAVKDARTPEERGLLLAKAEVTEIVRLARLGQYSPAKARIIELYEEIENRYLADPPDPPEPEGEELPEVEIAGADKVAAG